MTDPTNKPARVMTCADKAILQYMLGEITHLIEQVDRHDQSYMAGVALSWATDLERKVRTK